MKKVQKSKQEEKSKHVKKKYSFEIFSRKFKVLCQNFNMATVASSAKGLVVTSGLRFCLLNKSSDPNLR